MTSVCLLDISNGEHAFPPIDKILADHGYELVDAQELLDARSADCLICISDDAFGGDNLLRWLSLVNRTKVDLLVTHRNSYLVPAQTYISIPEGAQHHASLSDKLVAYIEARLKALAADSYNIPRLMPVPEELRGEYIGGNLEDLLSLLSDPGKRVVGASSGLLHNISSAPITTRREYDIARFVRWSQDRLDTSFVKLSLRLAGGESTGATVTRDVVSLADVLGDSRSSNLIVLKGAPGAGKTLQLRFLETLFAINSIRNGSPDDGPLAFCVSLGEHAASASDDPVEWLRGRWARRVQVDLMQDLDFHLRLGRLHLLLDGFNEIPFGNADDRRRWMLRWRTVIHDYLLENVTNYVAVACRSRDLNIGLGTAETSQTTAEMMPLTESEIVRIAELRNPAAAEELELAITSDPSLIGLYRTPFSLADYLEFAPSGVPKTQSDIFYRRIASALRRERDRLNFRIFNERWLPDEAVTRLLEQGSVAGGLSILRAVPLLNALGCFARDLIQKGVSAARPQHAIAADVDQAVEALKKYLHIKDSLAANDALYAAVDLDLLAVSEDVVKFSHQTLQEFFAACALTDGELLASVEIVAGGFANKLGPLAQVLKTLGPGDELPVLPSTGFEEIFARASESRPGLIDKAVAVNPWLSRERCRMSDMDDVSRSRIVSSLIRELSRRWRATEDARERIACLDALGELGWHYGQNHSGAQVDPILVSVPANSWKLGCGDEARSLLTSARSLRTVTLDEFQIGLFPVTNREFERFVLSDGYSTRRYWSLEGWLWRSGSLSMEEVLARWLARRDIVAARNRLPFELLKSGRASIPEAAAIMRFGSMTDDELRDIVETSMGREIVQPAFWPDPRFRNPLQPVVGVSWFEATAYCRWLSEQMGATARLPTEDEWDAAAVYLMLGVEGSIDAINVPAEWGETWGNIAELHLSRPSVVGAFAGPDPLGRGVPADMSGNVFEWVADPFKPGEDWRRACKGGSWRHLARRAHPGYRGRGDVTTRNDDDGFRVVIEQQT